MPNLFPCLWFNGQAMEAAEFYTSLFQGSKITQTTFHSKASSEASVLGEGSVLTVIFELEGRKFMALNGGPHFKFTPSLSLFVWCDSESEIERLWSALAEGGTKRMDLGTYPWSPKYGWTADRYGLEWQLNLTDKKGISPGFLFVDALFGKGDEALAFYGSVFKDQKVDFMARDESTNTILHCAFSLAGSTFVLMEGQGKHGFTFSPAFSFVVECKSQAEIDTLWAQLSHDPAAEQCGWLKDKYGVSWQIVPAKLGEMVANPKTSEKVINALMTMKKVDMAALEKAARS